LVRGERRRNITSTRAWTARDDRVGTKKSDFNLKKGQMGLLALKGREGGVDWNIPTAWVKCTEEGLKPSVFDGDARTKGWGKRGL